jgi:hypothetical protein
MPHPHRRRRGPKPDRRRALELLAASRDGGTDALMFANGFTAELLGELVRAGLASAHAERMVAGGQDDGGRAAERIDTFNGNYGLNRGLAAAMFGLACA